VTGPGFRGGSRDLAKVGGQAEAMQIGGSMPERKWSRRAWLGGAGALALGLAGCGRKPAAVAAPEAKPEPVKAAAVESVLAGH